MKKYAELERGERISKIMAERKLDLVLILENLAEELNISAILRSAEGFGVGRVCIIHEKSKKPKLSKNISSGATKWLEIIYFTSTSTCLNNLKKEGFKIIGAIVEPNSKPIWEINFKGKVAVMVGNEPKGLSKKAIKLSDELAYIPMFGLTESFNVSVSAGIFLYEALRQKEL
jgi:tRNA (guanosine-2'-O-)-methyltransferase